jgi:hypothetical protein
MALELNGNTKIAVRLAEALAIFGALVWFGYRAAKLESVIQKLDDTQNATAADVKKHCRVDWTLQHEMLMAARIKEENPDVKWIYPNPVRVHDDIRRIGE